jgi:hypothetical protein
VDLSSFIIAALALVIVFLLIRGRYRQGIGSRRAVARAHRALAGEEDAEALLEADGFTIIDRQVSCLWWITVDGEEEEVELRADLLVERDGERFIAEVKTGSKAPDPAFPPTRRQLLEYRLAFDPYGVLLVDVEAGAIYLVGFPRAVGG